MPSFHDVRFPIGISYGASGGPGFKTTITTLFSGAEKRNVDWSKARATYDVSQGLKTQGELNQLLKFFTARRGKAYGFRYKDWTDFRCPFLGEPLMPLGVTDGSTRSFQMIKTYNDSAASYDRILTKIVANTTVLYENGGAQGYAPDVNLLTGILTIPQETASVPGTRLAFTCEFDVPVRFDTDDMKVTLNDYNNLTWGSIPLVELRV